MRIHREASLLVVAALIAALGCYLSVARSDPEWMKRAGALISSVAAAAVLWQVKVEMAIEHELERITGEHRVDGPTLASSPIERLADKIRSRRVEALAEGLSRARLMAVAYVALTAIAGEILHGFGDLIFEAAERLAR
jgi:hypothetical protein